MEHFLGVDIGGTNVKCGVIDTSGNILYKKKYPTTEVKAGGKFAENFLKIIKQELKNHPVITKVGIGVPGMISKDRSTIVDAANIREMNGVNLLSILEKECPNITFHLENDANAAALGELHFGKLKLPPTFLFITMGTGIGGGAVIDGKIFAGGDGNGLEIGHIVAGNGKTIEQNIGKQGIVGLTISKLEGYRGKTRLAEVEELTYNVIEKAALQGDALGVEVFDEVGEFLGECIVSAVRILDIKTILIGGGVSETYPLIQKSMNEVIKKMLVPYYTSTMQIQLATLANNAGIVGAASLCFV